MKDIGVKFNCDASVIRRILNERGIETSISKRRKELHGAGKLVPHNKGKPFLVGEKNPMYGKENKWGHHTEKAKEMISIKNLGKKISEESKKKMSLARKGKYALDKHPQWQGGLSFEPYGIEFNKKLKRLVRKRDNQVCMVCGIHNEKLNYTLNIHHCNYNKTCNIPQNLISLCKNCHAKTNFNRPHWQKFFQSLLSERYNYQYNEMGEVILNFQKQNENIG